MKEKKRNIERKNKDNEDIKTNETPGIIKVSHNTYTKLQENRDSS